MVRHGQASFHGPDYDQLSPLGEEQSRMLGAYWADLKMHIDRVYVGPRRRHRQTLEAVAAVYRERGLPWPEAVELPELDEHSGQNVLNRSLPDLLKSDPVIREMKSKIRSDSDSVQRDYLRLFQKVTRLWVRRELNLADLEAWHEFRARVVQGIMQMTAAGRGQKTVVAFTSGGPIAAAMGWALGLDDEKTLELSWVVKNEAFTEFLFSGDRFSLVTFNAVPHLPSRHLLTFI